jgi:predicted permease
MTSGIGQDVKVGLRSLRRAPGFAAAAVAVLALGIGANVAIYSAVKATLLTPPPYPEPERLVLLDLTDASTEVPEPPRPFPWSYPKYRILADTADLPASPVAAYAVRPLTLTGAGEAALVSAEVVTPDYLDVLGVAPVLGRDLEPADDAPDAEPVALLGHALWRERFGADPAVVGRTVTLNGRPVAVAGVAPPGFRGLSGGAEVFVPVHAGAGLIAPFLVTGGQAHWLQAVGRLRPGASLEGLNARMAAVGEAAEAAFPDSDPTAIRGGGARSLLEARIHPQARQSLLVLSAAAMLLLLVACANLAGLFVARAGARSRETAVRIALGAGRWRAARGAFAESLLLAAAGGALGLLVARAGVELLAAAWPERFLFGGWNLRFADPEAIALDGSALAVAAALALATGLASGLLPALAGARRDPGRDLRAGATGALGGRGRRRGSLRGGLVAAEVAVTLVLVVGAGLLFRSLGELQAVDRGVEPEGLLVFEYSLPRTSRWAEDPAAFHRDYLERLRALPGVRSASLGCAAPLGGHCMITMVRQAGSTLFPEGARPPIGVDFVAPGFFETLGVPLLRGRALEPRDRRDAPPVVVLNETAARQLFPDGDALGRKVAMGVGLTPEGSEGAEVVGIVGDVLYDTPETGVMAEAYLSMHQEEGGSTVFLRAEGEPMALLAPARALLAQLDPDVPLHGARTLADLEATATADTRVLGGLLAVFAALALLLAATGVWAVVAHAVARRTRELGLRMALGALPRDVVALVVRQGTAPAVAGLLLGGALAWLGGRALRGLLYQVSPTDPVTLAGAALFLLAVSALAAWLPARRATRVDPMEALRAE